MTHGRNKSIFVKVTSCVCMCVAPSLIKKKSIIYENKALFDILEIFILRKKKF